METINFLCKWNYEIVRNDDDSIQDQYNLPKNRLLPIGGNLEPRFDAMRLFDPPYYKVRNDTEIQEDIHRSHTLRMISILHCLNVLQLYCWNDHKTTCYRILNFLLF
jgi:hypothetical protein